MIKHFHIFRHGQTDLNIQRVFQGAGVDSPLNDLGRQQAEQLAKVLKDTNIQIIFTSPLSRAQETARIANKHLKVKIYDKADLKEARLGVAEGKHKDVIAKDYHQVYMAWRALDDETYDIRFPGGESKREVSQRIVTCLKKIAVEAREEIIGISTHSGVIRYLLWYLGVKTNDIPNCSHYHLICKNGDFELQN